MADMEPGQIIIPHGPQDSNQPSGGEPEPDRPTEQPAQGPAPTPSPAPEPAAQVAAVAPAQVPAEQTEPGNGGWQFHQEADNTVATQPADLPDDITWTASEFIAHEKGASWYGVLVLVALVLTAGMYIITKDRITTVITLVVATMFGVAAGRKPRTQQYALSHNGIQIGSKMYGFHYFKTFSVSEEGAIASVVFMPLKRFMPALTIYVTPELEDQIVDFLATCLPFEQHKDDAVDNLLRRIRF